MSGFDKHVIVGLVVGVLCSLIFDNFIFIAVGAVYGILPDLDINSSIPFRWFLVFTAAYAIYMLVQPQTFMTEVYGYEFPQRYFAIPPLLMLIALQFIQHREFFHSITAGLLFAIPAIYFFSWQGFITAVLAFYSHLALDNELFDGLWT